MKPFDLEAAKNGAKVCTRDGNPVRIICFDRACPFDSFTIVALVKYGHVEEIILYTIDGRKINFIQRESPFDLMLKTQAPKR